jgi:hypothetical protein
MVNILRYIKNCGELRSGEIYMYLVGATSLVIIVNLLLLPLNKSQTINESFTFYLLFHVIQQIQTQVKCKTFEIVSSP